MALADSLRMRRRTCPLATPPPVSFRQKTVQILWEAVLPKQVAPFALSTLPNP